MSAVARAPLRAEDADALWPIRAEERVARWLGPPERGPFVARIAELAAAWDGGFGLWALRDAKTGAALGWGGISPSVIEDVLEVEVAWTVAPERWGEGIATTTGRAGLELATTLGLSSVVAYTQPDNAPSRAVMERLGMTYERDVSHAAFRHVLYRVRPEAPAAR